MVSGDEQRSRSRSRDRHSLSDAAVASEGAVLEKPATENSEQQDEASLPFQCIGVDCCKAFASKEKLRAHLLQSAECCAPAWQAVVQEMACLPGAGTTLWCPACPDGFEGRFVGSATKAASMMRHAVKQSSTGSAHAGPHRRLLEAIIEVMLSGEELPPNASDEDEAMREWARLSPLLQAAGPMLAPRSTAARKAVRQWQDEVLGEDECAFSDEDEVPEEKAEKAVSKKAKRKQEQASAGPGYNFYDESIPMDVYAACEDKTVRTADGVPIIALEDSSDDEATPQDAQPAPVAPSAPAAASGKQSMIFI
eukprot:TRINITY_DN43097_c0_g1_i1.p1 TRINITY_DN43097_c0_g1~~TRINITY_DN43097_c0_g1_i1.p1  ORF type:complete len:309 (+),score=66.07 TRINITY_DN43097_c0_g1_i1:224-1150(+)